MTTSMKIPSRELWSYFGYVLGQCFSFGLVGSFINYFYTDVLGISALAASTIFLVARAWDAIHDPLFASVMDTIQTRFGKFRYFMLLAPFLITLAPFYNIDAPTGTKILYAGATYILWSGFLPCTSPCEGRSLNSTFPASLSSVQSRSLFSDQNIGSAR